MANESKALQPNVTLGKLPWPIQCLVTVVVVALSAAAVVAAAAGSVAWLAVDLLTWPFRPKSRAKHGWRLGPLKIWPG